MRLGIVLTVYDNGINLQCGGCSVGFYSDWAHYFAEGWDWRPEATIHVVREHAIYLPR